jgi:predicted HD phosphohydrolase
MASTTPDPSRTTNDLIRLLEVRGTADYIGESISQLEHCLQAANFAAQAGVHISPFLKTYVDAY